MMRQLVPTHRCTVAAAEIILVSVASVSDPPPHRPRFVSNRNVDASATELKHEGTVISMVRSFHLCVVVDWKDSPFLKFQKDCSL